MGYILAMNEKSRYPLSGILTRLVVLTGLLMVSGLLSSGCAGRRMRRTEARAVILKIPGMNLPKKNVSVEGITQLGSRHAVAEATIKTAFKLEKSGEEWRVSEIRLAPQHWVPIGRLVLDLQQAQADKTREDMNLVALGLERYRVAHGSYPSAENFSALMDLIFPRYISRLVGDDAWSNAFSYEPDDAKHYKITSSGPDGKLGTDDDMIVSGVGNQD